MSGPVVLSWSGGKDSALALRELRRSTTHHVVGLLTTVTADHDRVSMHGIRRTLVQAQADAVGLPLTIMQIRVGASNDEYAASMGRALERFRDEGVRTIAFGDLHLEDVRAYREELVTAAGMEAIFPLWGLDTSDIARDFVDSGYRAILTCVDSEAVDPALAGRGYDQQLLNDLPETADPCGENGEFHTFVLDGPGFSSPVEVVTGERVLRDGRFMFCDLSASRPE